MTSTASIILRCIHPPSFPPTNSTLSLSVHRYQQVISLDPHNVRAYSNLALLHLDLRDYQKAEETFLHVLTVDPSYRSALYNLGVLYNHQQKLEQAVGYLEQLVLHHPSHLNGAQLLADCYFNSRQLDKADHFYHHVLKYHPSHVAALHNLGMAHTNIHMYPIHCTHTHTQTNVCWYTHVHVSYAFPGVVMAERSQYTEAIVLFRKVLAVDPSHEGARRHIEQARQQKAERHTQADQGSHRNRGKHGQRQK